MKKIVFKSFILLLILAFALLPLTACSSTSTNGGASVLTVYNCEDYIDEEIFGDFSDWYLEKYGKKIEINYITYDTNETMLTKVLNDDANVDLICTSEYAIQKLYKNGYLKPIAKTEGMDTINEKIYNRTKARFGEDFTNYFVPYMYGTLGILYNADYFEENGIDIEEGGWGTLWNTMNSDALKAQILMKDSIRDTFCAGVMYLKEQDKLPEAYKDYTSEQLINCTDDELVSAVKQALIDQKTSLKSYEVDFGKDDLINLNAYVDLAWSGDAIYAIEEAEAEDIALDYYVPEVGANIWFDGWFIPTCSKKVEAATAFIEFLCQPTISMRNMIYIGYTSAVDQDVFLNDPDSLALLEDAEYDVEEFFSWDVRYPDIDNPNYGMMTDYGDANTKMTIMWEEVKAATPRNSTPVWLISVIILSVFIVISGALIGTYIGLSKREIKILKK